MDNEPQIKRSRNGPTCSTDGNGRRVGGDIGKCGQDHLRGYIELRATGGWKVEFHPADAIFLTRKNCRCSTRMAMGLAGELPSVRRGSGFGAGALTLRRTSQV